MKSQQKSSKSSKHISQRKAHPGPGSRKQVPAVKRKTAETIKAVLIALFAALILRQFVIASYNVPTGSMKDTIMIGDFMFVNKFIYGARSPVWLGIPFTELGVYMPEWMQFRSPAIAQPKRNDIIVFDFPKDRKIDYIKRCVAVGGQTVEVKNGNLYVDGQPEGKAEPLGRKFDTEERYNIDYTRITSPAGKTYNIRHFVSNRFRNDNFSLTRVPENHFFMMGDNRDNSLDSRSWGFVPRDHIVGKPLMIWLSWNTHAPGYRFYDKIRWERLGTVIR